MQQALKIDHTETHMGGGRLIYSEDNPGIAVVLFNGDEAQREAYAKLFAMSPVLLAELKKTRSFIADVGKQQEELLVSVDQVISETEKAGV